MKDELDVKFHFRWRRAQGKKGKLATAKPGLPWTRLVSVVMAIVRFLPFLVMVLKHLDKNAPAADDTYPLRMHFVWWIFGGYYGEISYRALTLVPSDGTGFFGCSKN